MNVRDLAIELRPRSGWEAVDLGNALARQHYRNLLRIGFRALTIPTLILAVLCWQVPLLLPFFIWFLKPILDRFYLYYLSRSIFGQAVTVRETLAQWKRFFFKGSFSMLTIRRFTPFRAMTLPITELEGLTGAERGNRASIVTRVGGGPATGIAFGGLWLEIVFFLSVSILAVLLIPQGQGPEWYEFTSWLQEGELGSNLLVLCYGLAYGLVVLFLEPFYLASGFALYLNSRTSQESWDVELRFRELATRTNKASNQIATQNEKTPVASPAPTRRSSTVPLTLLAGLLLALTSTQTIRAAESEPQQVIAEVLKDKDFKRYSETIKVPKKNEDGWWQRFGDWLDNLSGNETSSGGGAGGAIAEGILRLVSIVALSILAAVIVVVIFKLIQNRRDPRELTAKTRFKRPLPSVVMGMDVTPDSLPDDLLGQAKRHWATGETRLAMSLLYRGALTHFITQSEIAIEASDTESECVRRVREQAPADKGSYFGKLSEQWMKVAYSTLQVSDSDFETLCAGWPFQQR